MAAGWFSGTLDVLKERGEKLRETTARLTEKTIEKSKDLGTKIKDVSGKVKEVAKQRLGTMETALQLQQHLEEKAKAANTLASIGDLHRSWVAAINRKDGPTYPLFQGEDDLAPGEVPNAADSGADDVAEDEVVKTDEGVMTMRPPSPQEAQKGRKGKRQALRQLSFKQVFLRSRALEISMQNVLSDPWMRQRYTPPAAGDQNSHSFYFFTLLQNTVSCPPEIWANLIRIAVETDYMTEYHINWLCSIFRVLKVDWKDEFFHGERKEMAVKAEQLRNEIRGVRTSLPSLSDQEIEKQHRKKVNASKELVKLYQGLRTNMEEALTHRKTSLKKRGEAVEGLFREMEGYKSDTQGTQTSTAENRENLEKALGEASENLKKDLDGMDSERQQIDNEIEALEERKRVLKLEIEQITQDLLAARERQKNFMQTQDAKRKQLYGTKDDFKEKIQAQEQTITECLTGKELVLQMQAIVTKTENQVMQALSKQISELSKKRDQFDAHFVEVLRDHCRYEDDRLTTVAEIAKASATRLAKLDEEDVVVSGNNNSKANQERVTFTKATNELEQVWTDIMEFRKTHADFIQASSNLQESMRRMEDKYRQIKGQIAPMLELVQRVSVTMPVSPSSTTVPEQDNAQQQPPPPQSPTTTSHESQVAAQAAEMKAAQERAAAEKRAAEEQQRQAEEQQRQAEEQRRQAEEKARQEQAAEMQRQQEAQRKAAEAAELQRQQEEAKRKQQEEEQRKAAELQRQKEEEAAAQKRKEEEEAQRKQQEEAERKKQEEAAAAAAAEEQKKKAAPPPPPPPPPASANADLLDLGGDDNKDDDEDDFAIA